MDTIVSLRRVERTCANCGKTFYAQTRKAKYCLGTKCKYQGWRKEHAERWAEYMQQWLADHPNYHSEYLKSEKGKEVQRKRHAKHPLHRKARYAVSNALKLGKITRPAHCQAHGCNETRLEAHHWKGYEPEHWLDVQWLCHAHHLEAERQ